jgi:hypothetical protein
MMPDCSTLTALMHFTLASMLMDAPPSAQTTTEALLTWFTGLLVLVGLLQASALIWQVKVFRRTLEAMNLQTKATETAANAALLNAQAVINAERAWLRIDIQPDKNNSACWILSAINKGKTPSELIEGYSACVLHPVDGNFVPLDNLMHPFIAPIRTLTVTDDSFVIQRIRPENYPIDNNSYPPMALSIYGRIVYWDTLTDKTTKDAKRHETRWCLTYNRQGNFWYQTSNGYSKND